MDVSVVMADNSQQLFVELKTVLLLTCLWNMRGRALCGRFVQQIQTPQLSIPLSSPLLSSPLLSSPLLPSLSLSPSFS